MFLKSFVLGASPHLWAEAARSGQLGGLGAGRERCVLSGMSAQEVRYLGGQVFR